MKNKVLLFSALKVQAINEKMDRKLSKLADRILKNVPYEEIENY